MHILAVLATIVMLWWAQSVIIPIVLSVLLGYALEPLILRFQSWHLPRLIAVPIVMSCSSDSFSARLLRIAGGSHDIRGSRSVGRPYRLAGDPAPLAGKPGTVTRMQAAANELEAATNTATKDDGQ